MKYLIMIIALLLIHSEAYSEKCVFTGTVYPAEKTEDVKRIYGVACRFFTNTFRAELDPNMKLDSVRYVNRWEDVNIVFSDDLYAFFYSGDDSQFNDIYINTRNYKEMFVPDLDRIFEDSMVFHEMIHFFFKSDNLQYLTENRIARNWDMEEVLAYWSQNQYIKGVTQGKNIMDYVWDDDGGFKLIDPQGFVNIAEPLHSISTEAFIYQAIHFLDGDPRGKYVKIVNNKYKPKLD